MDRNMTAIKAGGLVSSSSIMTNMVIFHDPVYIYLAIGGSIVSIAGLVHELSKHKTLQSKYMILFEIIKAGFLGLLLTPMLFMFYLKAGDKILDMLFQKIFEINLVGMDGMLNSFWFLGALLTSWYILPLWSYFIRKIFIKVKNDS